MSVVWPRSRRETPPTPAPDIAAEVDAEFARSDARWAAALWLVTAVGCALAAAGYIPPVVLILTAGLAVFATVLWALDRKKANQ
jgi:fatty acid desaturase